MRNGPGQPLLASSGPFAVTHYALRIVPIPRPRPRLAPSCGMPRSLSSSVGLAVSALLAFGPIRACAQATGHVPPAPPTPTLVVFVTVDQLRTDYLDRWPGQLTGGL